jgi:cytochrome c-type biogenesis protein
MGGIELGAAFWAGLISFISPCVLPLVPPYLTFIAGVTLDDLTDNMKSPVVFRRVMISAVAFVLGFSVVFVALGASASAIGQGIQQLNQSFQIFGQPALPVIAGVVIIIMGLHFLGVFRIGFLDREARFQVGRKPTGIFTAALIGMAFAFGWTPCIGPLLGTMLALAGTEETVGEGAVLLGVYSAGIAIPFLIAAAFAGPFMSLMKRFRRHMGKVEKVMGGFLVITGLLFIFGQITALSFWILETFPGLAEGTVL